MSVGQMGSKLWAVKQRMMSLSGTKTQSARAFCVVGLQL